jgi:SAM-dependent methyltransferase
LGERLAFAAAQWSDLCDPSSPQTAVTVELSFPLANRFKLASYFFSSLRKRGVWRTVKIAGCELYYDTKFGVKTGVVIATDKLDGDPEALRHASDSFPSSYLILKEAFSQAQGALRDAVLIDFGCGLGRALLFASQLPLRRIIGVELSPVLCAMARQNIDGFYRRNTKTTPEWSVVNADARAFDIPDDATVFYFFNPFDAVVLEATIERILVSVARAPRDCTVVYANPVHDAVLAANPDFELQKRARDYVIYRLAP